MTGSHEVRGSIPLISTTRNRAAASVAALFHGLTDRWAPFVDRGAPRRPAPPPAVVKLWGTGIYRSEATDRAKEP